MGAVSVRCGSSTGTPVSIDCTGNRSPCSWGSGAPPTPRAGLRRRRFVEAGLGQPVDLGISSRTGRCGYFGGNRTV